MTTSDSDDEAWWEEVYEARAAFFESSLGTLPEGIQKIMSLFGVWVGGGLFYFPTTQLAEPLWVATTFGLTNSDMPASVTADDIEVESDGERVTQVQATLRQKQMLHAAADGRAGYGYEMLLATREQEAWALSPLVWVAHAELLNDVDLLERVEQNGALTVEAINIGDDVVNVLIAKARAPFPAPTTLPNGTMALLIMTVITDKEMQWSFEHGTEALQQRLEAAGVGQISSLTRESVVG